MKRILLVIFTLISLNAFSQLQVKEGSFKHVPNAVMNDKYEHLDGNDLPMALIKISTENIPEQERLRLKFQGNLATQITKTPKTGQMWIYISAENATFINFMHPDYGTYKYYLPEKLCDFCTYEMVLQYVESKPELGFLAISSEPTDADIYIDGKHYGKTNNVITDLAVGTHELKLEKEGYSTVTRTFVTTKGETLKLNETLQAVVNKKTYLIVQVDQADAIVYIDGEMLGAKEVRKLVDDGTTHTYKIECKLYHEESGTVTVKDKTVVNKTLRPAFGYLNISSTPEQGANVWVDGELIGVTPIKTDKLASGSHTLRVMKDMYKMKEQSFTVTDGQTTNATLNMPANFVNVTINTDSQSDIYVDEEYKGKGKWTGRLSDGSHIFEARKTGHKPSKKSLDLVLGENKTITLDAPTPINGTIDIDSSPMGATIYIDGKHYGETPNYISDILIGEHELKLTKQGCAPITKTITIKEGETLTINEKLQTGKEISISTDKSGDKIYVDGNYVGVSPLTTNLSYGSHEIKAEREGKTVSETINVAQSGGDDSVKLAFVSNETITVNNFAGLQVKEGSFRYVPGGVIDDKEEYTDGNDLPMALIKISTENIPEQERMRLVFVGNRATQIIKKPKTGSMWIYISAETATFIDIRHPDYGTYKYYLPGKLCDYCVYEMVLQLRYNSTTFHEIKAEREGKTVSKTINVMQSGGDDGVKLAFKQEINGHEYVDLGLSVKWATCNVGASSPEDYGNYYAWGETTTKSTYTESNSKTYRKSMGDIKGKVQYDAARANWGSTWRLPTKAELEELEKNCTWQWITQNGVNGYKVTSMKNGNSIFLPAAGYRDGSSLGRAGSYGYYWSSTPREYYDSNAYCLCVSSSDHGVYFDYREYGLSVRPVVE